MEPTQIIVGLGHQAQNGKDSVAAAIIAKHPQAKRYGFSDALKAEVYEALINDFDPFWPQHEEMWLMSFPCPTDYTGDVVKQIAWIDGQKHEPSVRRLLQVWGTEYRRADDPLYWVSALSKRLHADKPEIALIADMRYRNEFYWIKGLGGVTVNVVRVGYDNGLTHASEHDLNGAPYDYLLAAGHDDLAGLQAGAVKLFDKICEGKCLATKGA